MTERKTRQTMMQKALKLVQQLRRASVKLAKIASEFRTEKTIREEERDAG